MKFDNSMAFARDLDKADPLADYRDQFHLPKYRNKTALYLCGNSLGLQPRNVEKYVKNELDDWHKMAVEGHMDGRNPWFYYHHMFSKSLAKLTGAKEQEVVAMNQLSVNLNLLLVSFYRPEGKRTKVLMQANEFPSDYYAIEQQIKFHGFNPKTSIIEVNPRKDEVTLRTEDIIAAIEQNKGELALVMFSAVNYYTGQLFDIKRIAEACKKHKITLGLDLAHAIGNVELKLNEWGVDFAVWCSYKYLNSGPGGVGGAFVHERHANNPSLPRFAGWWGNDEKTRFKMPKNFVPTTGADGWQMSNAPILSMAAHRAALDIFDKVGMKALRKKSELLTAYLEFLIKDEAKANKMEGDFRIITPEDKDQRGCQLSIQTLRNGKKLYDKISKSGIVADWREPDVIRVAPVPLYNRFEDVFRFVQTLCAP